jgi:hypothetical protein
VRRELSSATVAFAMMCTTARRHRLLHTPSGTIAFALLPAAKPTATAALLNSFTDDAHVLDATPGDVSDLALVLSQMSASLSLHSKKTVAETAQHKAAIRDDVHCSTPRPSGRESPRQMPL